VHKVALDLGALKIHWYGVLVAAGFLAGLWTASRRGLRSGMAPEKVVDLGPWLIVGAIVGARLLYVVSNWREVFAPQPWWEMFMVQRGGLVFFGGLAGAALVMVVYARWRKLPLWLFADVLAPSLALGHALGRLGCLMNGCCYGQPTSLPWAIHFPADHETHGHGVHPTQLYEALLNLALCAGLAWLYRRKKFDGQVFAVYLVGYALLRSFVELFRGDYPLGQLVGFATPAHWPSLGILLIGLLLWWKLPRPNAHPNPA
jgi:phosphatidylglycerol:prolipoprotein diacylglycerol transferase